MTVIEPEVGQRIGFYFYFFCRAHKLSSWQFSIENLDQISYNSCILCFYQQSSWLVFRPRPSVTTLLAAGSRSGRDLAAWARRDESAQINRTLLRRADFPEHDVVSLREKLPTAVIVVIVLKRYTKLFFCNITIGQT